MVIKKTVHEAAAQQIKDVGPKRQSGKLFRDAGDGFPVYLLDDGRFAVWLSSRWVVKSSVKAIEGALAKGAPVLRVFQVDDGISFRSRDVTKRMLTGILENQVVDENGKKQYKGYGHYYVHDDAIVAKLKDLTDRIEKAERDFNEEMEAIMKKARPVYRGNFKEMLEKHGVKK